MKQLSDIPSEMLKQSLEDLKAIEKNPNYRINMNRWHNPTEGEYCEVCHAGAVMANRLNAPIFSFKEPILYREEIRNKLESINFFRRGLIISALVRLGIKVPESFYNSSDLVDYTGIAGLSLETDLTEYKIHMCTIIGILESEGL